MNRTLATQKEAEQVRATFKQNEGEFAEPARCREAGLSARAFIEKMKADGVTVRALMTRKVYVQLSSGSK